MVERGNLLAALKRVRKNKGSPGIDGMTVDGLPDFLRENWERIRASLLDGSYRPTAVKRQEIPKSGGGVRQLGIPTVLDRFIQQAVLQVLQPIFDPTFSEHSYGFRPGRKAHDAVCQAQRYIQSGRRWVVDVDLEKFFDRVNHDVLMSRLKERIRDKRLLRVIRRYLEAGMMADGVVVRRHRGHAARRAAVAAAGERASGRSRSGAGEERTCVCALRGRLQRVRAVEAGGRAGDGAPASALREAPAQGQRGEERGGACVGPQVSGLQLLGSQGAGGQTSRRAEIPGPVQGARPADHEPERREVAGEGGGGAAVVPAGLEELLPSGGYTRNLSRPRPVDRQTAADGAAQTVEARDDGLS